MRCVDVIRELSVSKVETPAPAVADHLARCPDCAAWAARDARLGQLWDTTRPDDPGAEVWEPVWSRISDALDHAPADVLPLKPRSSSRRVWVVVLGVAQAAAVLVAVLYFRHAGSAPAPQLAGEVRVQPVSPEPATTSTNVETASVARREAPKGARVPVAEVVEIPVGELVVIRKDGAHFKADELALNSSLVQVDPSFEALNSLEAIAH